MNGRLGNTDGKLQQIPAILGLAQSREEEEEAQITYVQGIPDPEAWSGLSSEQE